MFNDFGKCMCRNDIAQRFLAHSNALLDYMETSIL